MSRNTGFLLEDKMVFNLDNKVVGSLSKNLYNFMQELYGVLDDSEIVHATKTDDYIKPDIVVTYKGIKKYISLKTGKSKSIHQEPIKSFVLFLRSLGISTKTQQTILLFQYGDGTMDGTGKTRYDYDTLRYKLHDRIIEANQELNKSRDFIKKVMERCLITGIKENRIPIDAIYHGDIDYGVVVTVKQINKHLSKSIHSYVQCLHIGPLQIRPLARYINKEDKYPEKRHRVEITWLNFSADMEFISRRYGI